MTDIDAERARQDAAYWLVRLSDNPGDQAQQQEFRAWLTAAPGNQAAWENINHTGNLLARAPALSASARPACLPAASHKRRYRFAGAGGLALAACLAVALLNPARSHADYWTGTATVKTVKLADGSTVRLEPGSAIKIAFFNNQRRVQLLRGDALFDVAHNAADPFSVAAPGVTITDIGTRFDVALLSDGVSVAVARGQVRVDGQTGSLDLRAGDWAHLGHDGETEHGGGLSGDTISGPANWVSAQNRPVIEVIDRIRPWYRGRIILTNPKIGEQCVTGVFDASNPSAALRALIGPQHGRVIHVTPWLLLVTGK